MRHTAAEKHEIIGLVEGSDLSVRQTLRELQVNRSTFYAWYRRYTERGGRGYTQSRQPHAGTGTGFPHGSASAWSKLRWRIRSGPRGSWHGS